MARRRSSTRSPTEFHVPRTSGGGEQYSIQLLHHMSCDDIRCQRVATFHRNIHDIVLASLAEQTVHLILRIRKLIWQGCASAEYDSIIVNSAYGYVLDSCCQAFHFGTTTMHAQHGFTAKALVVGTQ